MNLKFTWRTISAFRPVTQGFCKPLYARQLMGDLAFEHWTQVIEEELWAYLRFSTLMAINHLPALADYWKTNKVFHYAPIAGHISRNRFFDISRYLHFVVNTILPPRTNPSYNWLQKIQPVIDMVMTACMAIYDPSVNISIDEAMITFKGRASIKQYLPKKPTKREINLWVCTVSSNGYVSQFSVYTGKQGNRTEVWLWSNTSHDRSQANNIFMDNLANIFMDTFFSSVPLSLNLLRDKMYYCGTVHPKRKFIP